MLVATSAALVSAVQDELARQIASLPRCQIAAAALEGSVAVLVETLDDAAAIANLYAPEHLSIQTAAAGGRCCPACAMPAACFRARIRPRRPATIVRERITCCRPPGRRGFRAAYASATFQKQMTVQRLTRDRAALAPRRRDDAGPRRGARGGTRGPSSMRFAEPS